jgi:hypothetical protein
VNTFVNGSIKTLTEPRAERFRRRWVLRNVVTAAPFVALIALPAVVVLGGIEGIGFWKLTVAFCGAVTGSAILRTSLGLCPGCRMPLEGWRTPSVCKHCRILLCPGSQEGWETLQRLSRPPAILSPVELEEFAIERGRRKMWVGVVFGAFAIGLVGSEYFHLDMPWFVSAGAVPVGLGIIKMIARTSRCPTCTAVIPLAEDPPSCESCGTALARNDRKQA